MSKMAKIAPIFGEFMLIIMIIFTIILNVISNNVY